MVVGLEYAGGALPEWITYSDSFDVNGHHVRGKVEVSTSFTFRATVIENISTTFYWGTDIIAAYVVVDTTQPSNRGIKIYGGGDHNSGEEWDGWRDYFESGGADDGIWTSFYVHGDSIVHEPPAIRAKVAANFDPNSGYLTKNAAGVPVVDTGWLPDPNHPYKNKVGLVFSYYNNGVLYDAMPVYDILYISTWQGESMNYPVGAPAPHPTESDSLFDFQIYDPDSLYEVTVIDFDSDISGDQGSGWGVPINADYGDEFSQRRYNLRRTEPATGGRDTLWLIAKDYGAHAIVQPRGGGKLDYSTRLKGLTAFGDTLWSVSVPRDNDGYGSVGINLGDYMADAWEEDALGVGTGDRALFTFLPFIGTNANGRFQSSIIADVDNTPVGRGIDGDLFTNWCEYRGFRINKEYALVSTDTTLRMDPFKKSAFLYFMDNVPDTVRYYAPAYTEELRDSMEVNIVKYMQPLTEADRRKKDKVVNINSKGSSSLYFGYDKIVNQPDKSVQNAITYWNSSWWDDWYWESELPDTLVLAATISIYETADSAMVPSTVERVVIFNHLIDSLFNAGIYPNNPNMRVFDEPRVYSKVISHEFGHGIGMEHFKNMITIMGPVFYDTTIDRFQVHDTVFDSTYADTSYSQIMLRGQ